MPIIELKHLICLLMEYFQTAVGSKTLLICIWKYRNSKKKGKDLRKQERRKNKIKNVDGKAAVLKTRDGTNLQTGCLANETLAEKLTRRIPRKLHCANLRASS